MSWICKKCNRPFKHINQWHSCVKVDADTIFANQNPNVKKCYDKLLKEVQKFGKDVKITAALKTVFAKAPSTFIAMKPRKDHLVIEFLLDDERNEFPIEKTFRVSKNRVAHFLRVQNPSEIDRQLLGWMRDAYELIRK